jgi:pimeloyl-ACP methyl ester carboxylesterase
MSFITTNDGAQLWYDEKGTGKALVMLPGWGCSPEFFKRNFDELAKSCHVVRMSLRGHYKSEKVEYGHRISRYAADLRDLIVALDLKDDTALGWSMGAAIIWSHYDLFQDDYISRMVIVEQSPRQYAEFGGQGWTGIQAGCYDMESLMVLNTMLQLNSAGVAAGLGGLCFPAGETPTEEETAFFTEQIEMTPWWVRADIMVDHTNLDWRDLLPTIKIPTLVLAGRKNQVFLNEGTFYPGKVIPGAEMVVFEESGHMPFYNEAEKFNKVVAEFVNS